MRKRYPHKSNILLVNITRLGDMLQATPTIVGMKMENPNAKIAVLVEKQFADVCKLLPGIDEVKCIDLGMVVRSLAREQDGIVDAYEYVSTLVDEIKSESYDYCLNMSSSAYTALMLNLVGIPRNGGWSSDEEGFRKIESSWAQLFATSVFHQNRQYNSLNLVDVFRCSADVSEHPNKLMLDVPQEADEFMKKFLAEAQFTNRGPLIAIQAGASQKKRQWASQHFIKLISLLLTKLNARIVLTGTKKELEIIEPIYEAIRSPNVVISAGKTSIPQLAALLKMSDICITGDTGPMHMSVAVGTPVISMFLASAYGFETGPYGENHIVLQPVIGCGPCNPNKACAKTECHDTISPELVAELVEMRLRGPLQRLPENMVDQRHLTVYQSEFDQYGFCDFKPLHPSTSDPYRPYREAYRKLWLEDIGGYEIKPQRSVTRLRTVSDDVTGLQETIKVAEEGRRCINHLIELINNPRASAQSLGQVNAQLNEIDRIVEELGYHYSPLGPLARMFVFGKENIAGTDAAALASEMGGVYDDLARRGKKLGEFLAE